MRRTTTGLALLALAAFVLAAPHASAQAEDPEAYGDGYATGDAGRIRYEENGATILRAPGTEDLDRDAAGTRNSPLFPGDTLTTDRDQRVEVELAGGTVVRADRGTEVEFLALPRPYAKFRDNTVLRLASGSLQITALVAENEEFRIDTPAGSVYLLDDGDFRVDVDAAGRTRVASRRGVAEVVGEGGSVLVRGGMRTNVYPGTLPEDPRAFNTFVGDGFDRWAASREDAYRSADRLASYGGPDSDALPYEVRPYYRELSAHGTWVSDTTYGWVWSPSSVAYGWRPYSDGYWAWGPGGYFWVSYEPWGWAPYRYGRWSWIGGRGWCWIPGRVFAGAWVSWSWGSAWIGWAPLGYWGYPAYYSRSLYWDRYDPYCWTFVSVNHIHRPHVSRHAVPVERIAQDIRSQAIVTRAPQVAPRRVATSPEWKARAARMAAEDRGARIERLPDDRRAAFRMDAVESRLRDRRLAAGAPADRRDADRGRAVVPARPGPRAASPGRDVTDRSGRTDLGSGREGATRPPTAYPRRIVEDPRGRDAAPQSRERRDDDRVRSLYDRLSGPRRTRDAEPGEERARPVPERPSSQAPRAPETRGRDDSRFAPRREVVPQRPQPRETPREAPRAEPQRPQTRQAPREAPRPQTPPPAPKAAPRPAPRPQPSRPSPKKESPKRDDGGKRGKSRDR